MGRRGGDRNRRRGRAAAARLAGLRLPGRLRRQLLPGNRLELLLGDFLGRRREPAPADRRLVGDELPQRRRRAVFRIELDVRHRIAGHRPRRRREVGRRRQRLLDDRGERGARELLREDGESRRAPLAVVLLERLVDPDLGRRGRNDLLSGHEEELVQDAQVGGIAQDDPQIALVELDGNRGVADRELRRQRGGHVARNRPEARPRNVLAAVLLGQRLAHVVLGDGAPLDEQSPDAAAGEALDGERAVHALLGQGAGADEEDAESRHVWCDYRVLGVSQKCSSPGACFSQYRKRRDSVRRREPPSLRFQREPVGEGGLELEVVRALAPPERDAVGLDAPGRRRASDLQPPGLHGGGLRAVREDGVDHANGPAPRALEVEGPKHERQRVVEEGARRSSGTSTSPGCSK